MAAKNTAVATVTAAVKAADTDLTKSAARALLRPYAETDATLAARVLSLVPFVIGRGMSARQIVAAVEATVPAADIPTGFTVASVSRGASVARLMHDTENPLPGDLSKTATHGIAAALMRIVSRESDAAIGGGTDGMARALDAAVTGTTNGAEIAERLTAEAAQVAERSAASRREKRSITQPARNAGGTTSKPAALTPEGKPASKVTEPEHVTPVATPAQVARNLETGVMLGELLRRLSDASAVVTPATVALFDQVAQAFESATVSSGKPAAKQAAAKRAASKRTAPAQAAPADTLV